MKIALIVGIDHYTHVSGLHGCVNDAYSVDSMLKRNDGGSVNFETKLMTSTGPSDSISKSELKDSIKHLFTQKAEIAVFYFAGHGHIESTGGYLVASDAQRGDDGLALNEIMMLANRSPATNKLIILDSCHSGYAGASPENVDVSTLAEGMTILTASTAEQYASEENGSGIFTSLMVDALSGSAANLVGQITPGSIYAHIDQSLGAWDTQRPVFKTNIKSFVSLRDVTPPISLEDLRSIIEYFPKAGFEYQLDPTYEPELRGRGKTMPKPLEEHTRIFARLQKFNKLNLLVPINAPHMWHATMESKTCKLTALGEHYRRLVAKGRLG
ncbi:caspase domain-containing protein [Mucilaginibacter sp. OK098]|uniref:caspase family protein n=1 Tax=Mucilaginibacter sp. OK098 TaxID=1855297 RepID=UPI0009221B7E|nr:caspase family protein [Mucilaginibacter sp. OK098]SHM77069.1 Caspase domain-containing protein [Mucilaginibacter sp. OK098]